MPNFIRNFLYQQMKKKAGDLLSPVLRQSVGRLGLRDLPSRFTTSIDKPLRSFPGRNNILMAPGLPAPPVSAASTASKGISPYVVGGVAIGGGTTLGGALAATNQIEGALNQVGPAVDRFFGQITPQAIQQFGKNQENKGWGGALEMATPLGFLAAPFIPNTQASKTAYTQSSGSPKGTRPVGTQAVLNGKPVYWGGDDYGWQLLNQTGSSATLNSLNSPGAQNQFIQDSFSGTPGGAVPTRPPGTGSFTPLDPYAAQNREYERERARVEAMVKANPDMQKQAVADERAKVRDQGMAIWAKANPTLAAKLQPDDIGYAATRGAVAGQAATQGFGYQLPQQVVLTPPPGVNAPQSFPTVESITPTEAYGAQGIQTDPEMIKKFQTFLNLTKK
jgi:hypothetical protein